MLVLASDVMERICSRLTNLYGVERERNLMARIELLIGRYGLAAECRNSQEESNWSQADSILITYGDMVTDGDEKPLVTLKTFLDEKVGPRIPIVHILPFFPWTSDDGFAVVDYRQVAPELGGWEEIEDLAGTRRLMVDLVLNHVSSASRWFRSYCIGMAPERDFFIEVEEGTDLRDVVRPRMSPLLKEVQTPYGRKFVWTTFSQDQVDLDFANPDVLFELLDVLLFYIYKGARVIRLDAIAYLWKEVGTSCIHLWQTHEIVKLMRDVLSLLAPNVLLLTETNVPHKENVSYFGDGDEAQIVYQFSLPPLLLHALHFGDARHLVEWAKSLGAPPEGCTYLNFSASHDGIGLRPLEGLVPKSEIDALIDDIEAKGGLVSRRSNADGSTTAYELNTAWFSAVDVPGDAEKSIAKFLCSQTLVLGLQGIPAVYFNNLFAAENDLLGVERTGRARSINRRKWARKEIEAFFDAEDETREKSIFEEYLRRLELRASQAAFHPDSPQRVLDLPRGLFGVKRGGGEDAQAIFMIANVTGDVVSASVNRWGASAGFGPMRDLLSGEVLAEGTGSRKVSIGPWRVVWLVSDGLGEGGAATGK
jgi:sucrose phosphorylase